MSNPHFDEYFQGLRDVASQPYMLTHPEQMSVYVLLSYRSRGCGYTYTTDAEIAAIFGVTRRQAKLIVEDLRRAGFIKTSIKLSYSKQTKSSTLRIIYPYHFQKSDFFENPKSGITKELESFEKYWA